MKKILASVLSKEESRVTFPCLKADNANDLLELKCCNALKKIRDILKEDTFDDPECFMRIEKIVCLFKNDFNIAAAFAMTSDKLKRGI